MEASLHSISTADSEAQVDVVVYSEGQWGGMVDEMGVPVDWDVPSEICEDLGLHCTQVKRTLQTDPNRVLNLFYVCVHCVGFPTNATLCPHVVSSTQRI